MSRGPDDRNFDGSKRPKGGGPISGGKARGPKPLSDILGDLFAARGLARVQATGELEAAWADAIGEPGHRHTRVDGLRRGVLNVIVAHPTLLAELASFQKPDLLASLRRSLVGTPIHDIRFRVGPVDRAEPPTPPPPRRPGRDRG